MPGFVGPENSQHACRQLKLLVLAAWGLLLSAVTSIGTPPRSPPLPPLLPPPPPLDCRTSTFGATPSRTRYATAALQASIDACSGPRCGTVVVDLAGAYLTASLLLTGCVHLVLPAGVTLLAGTQRLDYGPDQPDWYLLLFRNCTHCTLSGGGTVDGQARRWVLPSGTDWQQDEQEQEQQQEQQDQDPEPGTSAWQTLQSGSDEQQHWSVLEGSERGRQLLQQQQPGSALLLPRKAVRNWADPSCAKADECRPRLVGVVDSSHVSVTGLHLTDPVYWCLHVLRSRHVDIRRVTVRGDWDVPNNDGIDVDSSRHVSITAADVDTADDAICLKTTCPGWPLEHVRVRDCRLRSRSSAVKLGSESVADMRHISIASLDVSNSHRGLAIQLRDGGSISHVRFERISLSTRYSHPSWWGAAEPIHLTAVPRSPGSQVGRVTNVTFADIQAVAENGVFIAGGPLPLAALLGTGGGGGSSSSGGMPEVDSEGASSTMAHAAADGPEQQQRRQGQRVRQQGQQEGHPEQLLGRRQQQRRQGQRVRQQGQQEGHPEQLLGRRQQQRHSISGVTVKRLRLRLQRRSCWPGGCQDFRPSHNTTGGSSSNGSGSGGNGSSRIIGGGSGSSRIIGGGSEDHLRRVHGASGVGWWPAGLDCSIGSTAAVWVAGADDVLLSDVEVEYCQPWRDDWGQQVHIDAGSTSGIRLHRVQVWNASCGSQEVHETR